MSETPDSSTCARLCEEFASITNTDTACGHFFLQDCDWKLGVALNRFFQKAVQEEENDKLKIVEIVESSSSASASACSSVDTSSRPIIFKWISWNVDGLDDKNRGSRTKAACEEIKKEMPLVAFLQEVIFETYRIFESELDELYSIFPSSDRSEYDNYFTAILLHKKYVKCKSVDVQPFPTSQMDRCLLKVEADVCNKPFVLMTSHLESTKECAAERVKQLHHCWNVLQKVPPEKTVLFGGDLNLRDPEVEDSLPNDVFDVWVRCGSKKSDQFTWDCAKNDNVQGFGKYKPRCRFDRLYVKPSKPAVVKVDDFRLIGQQKIRSCLCYPSDHWGLCCQLSFVP